ncbi:MAG: hypothetical protein QGG64_05540 [Candidatus Latescibacteria bacterium]|nr:hypothetical protein [Candidatus Latescibacterota bacterium]
MRVTFNHFINIDEAKLIAKVEVDVLPVGGSIVYLQDGNDVRRWRVLDHNWVISRVKGQSVHEASVIVNLLPIDG